MQGAGWLGTGVLRLGPDDGLVEAVMRKKCMHVISNQSLTKS